MNIIRSLVMVSITTGLLINSLMNVNAPVSNVAQEPQLPTIVLHQEMTKVSRGEQRRVLSMSADLFAEISKSAKKHELPDYIWYPIVMTECSGNPRLIYKTSNEKSYGVFQVNIRAHPEADVSRLLDVDYNCDWQMPILKRWYDDGLTNELSGVILTKYVARYGQAPQWTQWYQHSLDKYYSEIYRD
jgi:hypothetical protein